MKFRRFEKLIKLDNNNDTYVPLPFELLHTGDIFRVFEPNGTLLGAFAAHSEPYPLADGNGSVVAIPHWDAGSLVRLKKARA